jgi:hypothetical protein
MDNKESLITEKYITISMEEYKELLMIKGRYEELKSRPSNPIIWSEPHTKTIPEEPYKITL